MELFVLIMTENDSDSEFTHYDTYRGTFTSVAKAAEAARRRALEDAIDHVRGHVRHLVSRRSVGLNKLLNDMGYDGPRDAASHLSPTAAVVAAITAWVDTPAGVSGIARAAQQHIKYFLRNYYVLPANLDGEVDWSKQLGLDGEPIDPERYRG